METSSQAEILLFIYLFLNVCIQEQITRSCSDQLFAHMVRVLHAQPLSNHFQNQGGDHLCDTGRLVDWTLNVSS